MLFKMYNYYCCYTSVTNNMFFMLNSKSSYSVNIHVYM